MFQFASSAPLSSLLLASFIIVLKEKQHSELLFLKAQGAPWVHSLVCTLRRFNSYKWLMSPLQYHRLVSLLYLSDIGSSYLSHSQETAYLKDVFCCCFQHAGYWEVFHSCLFLQEHRCMLGNRMICRRQQKMSCPWDPGLSGLLNN